MSSVNQIESLFGFSVILMDLISNIVEKENKGQSTKDYTSLHKMESPSLNLFNFGNQDLDWHLEFGIKLLILILGDIGIQVGSYNLGSGF